MGKLRDPLTGIEWREDRPVPQGVVVARCMVTGAVIALMAVATLFLALAAWRMTRG